jgi:molybdopterin-binding protein
MKLSTRNIINGNVVSIKKDTVAAEVQVDIGNGQIITSTITTASVERLQLQEGKAVSVLIKASDVMLAIED